MNCKTVSRKLLLLLFPFSLLMPAYGQSTYTIVNQPPVSSAAYYNNASSLWTKKILNAGNGGPYNHLMPGGDSIIALMLGMDSHGNPPPPSSTSGGFLTGDYSTPGDRDESAQTLYIARASDPVYKLALATDCGPVFEPKAHRTSGVIDNLLFHAPNGAIFAGPRADQTAGSSDEALNIWDLSGDSQDISNGFALHFYGFGKGMALPSCPSGTIANPCIFDAPGAGHYCGYNDVINGRDYDNGGGAISNAGSPFSAVNRFFELTSGHFHHAAHGATACEGTSQGNEPNVVFPNSGGKFGNYWGDSGAFKCANQLLGPPNGSLYYLDYTDAQLACMDPGKSTTCTGLDGVPVAKLDPSHFALVEQLTYYGWYEADTGGGTTHGMSVYHQESSEPYTYYHNNGFTNPDPLTGTCPFCFQTFVNYMAVHCAGLYTDPKNWCYHQNGSLSGSEAWQTRILYNLPNGFPGPNNGANGCSVASATVGNCGVGMHLHIADPCVAVKMAGLTADPTGRWTACSGPTTTVPPPAKPQGAKFQ